MKAMYEMNEMNEMKAMNQYATYCPEDNKLRLYVGRVPRDEYEALRRAGWTCTPKQTCNFVAYWTPDRENTALEYGGGEILDEDQDPGERAADRADRFAGYLNKRITEAEGHANGYEAGPQVHGYQNQERADRAVAKHDRQADKATNCWNKAEYWQMRTASVIRHALYVSGPGVRMGRIKTLEAELRKAQAAHQEYVKRWQAWQRVLTIAEPEEAYKLAYYLANTTHCWKEYKHPRPENCSEYTREHGNTLYGLLTQEKDPISGHEAAALWLEGVTDPETNTGLDARWRQHYALRLAYENQMLEAQGGRLEQKDIEPGGMLGGKLIIKVSKSCATGRATSVDVIGPATGERWTYHATNLPGTRYAAYKIELERLAPGAYQAPTMESLSEYEKVKAEIKAGREATTPKAPPLVNPTDEEAERLQAAINAAEQKAHAKRNPYGKEFIPGTICRITQALYSANSKGAYAGCEPRKIYAGGALYPAVGPVFCKVRFTQKKFRAEEARPDALRVIILTDKPQKALPVEVWQIVQGVPEDESEREPDHGASYAGRSHGLTFTVNA